MGNSSTKPGKQQSRSRRVWIFVVDSGNKQDLNDLDHLDAILWGSNPNARRGDLVLMYRSAPHSDIAYVFTAASDARETKRGDRADTKYVIQLSDKVQLVNPIKLESIKANRALSKWSFARNVQGIMRHRKDVIEEGAWPALQQLIIKSNQYVAPVLRAVSPTQSRSRKRTHKVSGRRQLKVFISYGSPDLKKVENLYRRLRRLGWIEPWFNKEADDLSAGDPWEMIVPEKIQSSDAMIICLSKKSVNRAGFFQTEMGRALRLQEQQPEGTSFIVPIKLDECKVPRRLSNWHCAELFRKRGFNDLVSALERRANFLAQVS
jgi:TIR domain